MRRSHNDGDSDESHNAQQGGGDGPIKTDRIEKLNQSILFTPGDKDVVQFNGLSRRIDEKLAVGVHVEPRNFNSMTRNVFYDCPVTTPVGLTTESLFRCPRRISWQGFPLPLDSY